MQWPEVQQRVASGEGRDTEFKRSLDFGAIDRAICAFANTAGGLVVVGVEDSGEIRGIAGGPESVLERVSSFLQSGCNAPVQASVGNHEVADRWVYWISVPAQRGLEPLRHSGRVWVRRERSSVEPSPTELQELYNAFGYILTEERAMPGFGIGDIDIGFFREHLHRLGLDVESGPQPSVEDDLRNRGVLEEFDGALRPTLYGLLAFGKAPQGAPQTGNFWVECVAYGGTDQAAEAILVSQAKGRLDEQVSRAVSWARAFGHRERYGELRREDEPVLPLVAIREALVNAVVHRDYALTGSKILFEVFTDRVQITSPGALPNHMTVAAVKSGGRIRTRNELIANHLLELRFMEQRGRGWMVMRQEMRNFNDTEPQIDHDADSRFVTIRLPLRSSPYLGIK